MYSLLLQSVGSCCAVTDTSIVRRWKCRNKLVNWRRWLQAVTRYYIHGGCGRERSFDWTGLDDVIIGCHARRRPGPSYVCLSVSARRPHVTGAAASVVYEACTKLSYMLILARDALIRERPSLFIIFHPLG